MKRRRGARGRSLAEVLLGASMLVLAVLPVELGSESLVLQSYYPSPLGIYSALTTTGDTALARDGGKVGVGTSSPAATLDVNGAIKVAGGGAACGAATEGSLRYSTATHAMEFCDGSGWGPLGGGGGPTFIAPVTLLAGGNRPLTPYARFDGVFSIDPLWNFLLVPAANPPYPWAVWTVNASALLPSGATSVVLGIEGSFPAFCRQDPSSPPVEMSSAFNNPAYTGGQAVCPLSDARTFQVLGWASVGTEPKVVLMGYY